MFYLVSFPRPDILLKSMTWASSNSSSDPESFKRAKMGGVS